MLIAARRGDDQQVVLPDALGMVVITDDSNDMLDAVRLLGYRVGERQDHDSGRSEPRAAVR